MTAKPRYTPHFPQPMHIEGTFFVPDGSPRLEYIMPDEAVAYYAERYGLCLPNMRGIDPFCGTGWHSTSEGCDNQFTELLFTRAHEFWLYEEPPAVHPSHNLV